MKTNRAIINPIFVLQFLFSLAQVELVHSQMEEENTSTSSNTTTSPNLSDSEVAKYSSYIMMGSVCICVALVICVAVSSAYCSAEGCRFFRRAARAPLAQTLASEEAPVELSEESDSDKINNESRWSTITNQVEQLEVALNRFPKEELTEAQLGTITQLSEQLQSIDLPPWFLDPISGDFIKNPAVTDDGYSYDIKSLQRIKAKKWRTPGNSDIPLEHIIANTNLDRAAKDFLDKNEALVASIQIKVDELRLELTDEAASHLSRSMV